MTRFIVIPSSSSSLLNFNYSSSLSSSKIIISRTSMMILTFIIMMIKSSMGQIVTNGCISLQGSNSCSGFQKYYLGATAVNNVLGINVSSLNTINDLDDQLLNYTHSSLDYMSNLGCVDTSSSSNNYPYARYALSRLCAGLIQDTQTSLPCNYNNNIQPLPLCQSTCQQWVSSVTNITNSSLCPNQQKKNQALTQLDDSCDNWSGYNGQSPQCISGDVNEPNNCGFNDNNSDACTYCKNNPSDTCCQSIKCNKLSTGAIIGIVIGCLIVFGGIIGSIIFFFCCKKKRIRRETSFSFKTYIQPSTQSKTNNGVFDASEDHNSSHKVLIDSESQFQYYNHHGNNSNNNRSPVTPTFPTINTPLTNNTTLNNDHHHHNDFLDDGNNSDNNNNNNNNHRRGSSSASNPFGDRFEVISLHNQSTKSNIPTKSTPLVTIDTASTIATTNGINNNNNKQQRNIGNGDINKDEDEEPIYDEEFYQVVHPYPPQMVDELGLNVGDVVCLAMSFDDGWALGFNVNTGLKGVFPLVCVSPLPPQLLEQLYQKENNNNNNNNNEQFSSKVLIEEENNNNNISSSIQYTQPQPPPPLESINLNNNNNNNNNNQQQQSPMALHNIRKIREDLRRSLSLSSNYSFSSINNNNNNNNNHSPSLKHLSRSHTLLSSSSPTSSSPTAAAASTNIPKRTASMMRSKQKQEQNYNDDDYYELNSPTHHTPLVSIPPPTSPSKIVLPTSPKTETFEMYNHRISKLQQD